MRSILFFLIILTACYPNSKKDERKTDSVPAVTDYTITTSDTSGITNQGEQITKVLGKDVKTILEEAYAPNRNSDGEKPGDHEFLSQSVDLLKGEFTTLEGKCVNLGDVLFSLVAFYIGPVEEETNDGDEFYTTRFSLLQLSASAEKVDIIFRTDFDKGKSTLNMNAWANKNYALSAECSTIAIEFDDHGGTDLPWHKRILYFYLLDGLQAREVLNIELVSEYTMQNIAEGPEQRYSENAIVEILESKTNDLKDIKVRYLAINQDGTVANEKNAVFAFNGKIYEKR